MRKAFYFRLIPSESYLRALFSLSFHSSYALKRKASSSLIRQQKQIIYLILLVAIKGHMFNSQRLLDGR